MIGTTIKEFKLLERLGKGGWGEVWAAEQQIVKTRVAIKLLRSDVSGDQDHVRRFFNEAIAVAAIPHAGIVKIFDVGFERDQAFLIMELLPGEALATRIRRETRLPLDEVIDIGRQIVSVLVATHDAGIVHRDLKPDNVFVVPDAELGERVKILDFGIAKLSTSTVTGTGALGTPAYMAPEQWNNAANIDGRADLYSLGCVLFEMCCGRPPFVARSPAEACTKHLSEAPPRARSLAPGLPIELDELIDRLLAKRQEDRPTLPELDRQLAAAASGAPRAIRPMPRGSGPNIRIPTPSNRSTRSTADGTAETQVSTSDHAATVTSLAGAVIAHTQPPKQTSRRTLVIVGGALGIAAIATGIGLATRSNEPPPGVEKPVPEIAEPTIGLKTIADYREPTPATIGNHRSVQVWSTARDNFARACARPGATARWCAGEQFAIAELALIRDDVPGSIRGFELVVKTDPSWSTGYLGLSNARAYARELDHALAAASTAQELEPTSWQPALASARAYMAAHQVDDALIEYRRAMSLSPPNNALLLAEVALAFHYAYKDGEAQRLAAMASALAPSLVNVNILKAELALEANHGEEALAFAESALAASPKNGAALIARGDALALLGKRDEAVTAYRHALKLRGGLNILAISEPRLLRIEAALALDQLPTPRSDRTPAGGGGGKPVDQSSGNRRGRTRASGTTGSTTGSRSFVLVPGPTPPAGALEATERSPSGVDSEGRDRGVDATTPTKPAVPRSPPREQRPPQRPPRSPSNTVDL